MDSKEVHSLSKKRNRKTQKWLNWRNQMEEVQSLTVSQELPAWWLSLVRFPLLNLLASWLNAGIWTRQTSMIQIALKEQCSIIRWFNSLPEITICFFLLSPPELHIIKFSTRNHNRVLPSKLRSRPVNSGLMQMVRTVQSTILLLLSLLKNREF